MLQFGENQLQNINKSFLAIILAGFISFGLTLSIGFIWDDHEMIENNPHIQSISIDNIRHAFQSDVFNGKGDAYFRPLQTLWNMADYQVWGENPFGFHLTNLLFHIAGSLLLFLILQSLFKGPFIPLVSALFFVVHPAVIEQFINISGRAGIMANTFILAALFCAMRKEEKLYYLSIFLYALACLSKESGIIFPLFLVLLGTFYPKFRMKPKRYVPYGLVAIIYMWLRSFAVDAPRLMLPPMELLAFVFRDFPMIIFDYVSLVLFPFDLHSHHRMDFGWGLLIQSWVFLLLVIGFIIYRRPKVLILGALWFLIGLLPKIPLFMHNALMLDHWIYPSSVGIFIIMSAGLMELKNKKWAKGVAGGFIVLWCAVSWVNALGRNTDKKLYLWALDYKSSSIVRYNLGLIYLQEGNLEQAEALFRDSLRVNPNSKLTQKALAITLQSKALISEGK